MKSRRHSVCGFLWRKKMRVSNEQPNAGAANPPPAPDAAPKRSVWLAARVKYANGDEWRFRFGPKWDGADKKLSLWSWTKVDPRQPDPRELALLDLPGDAEST